jgi:TolB-like protein
VSSRNIFEELKRRNVYKVAVAYVVVSWLLIQAASNLLPTFDAPTSAMKILVALLVIGFPIALGFSWAFEITPEGIKKESEVTPEQSIASHTGRRLVGLTIVLAVIAAALFAFQMLRPKGAHVAGEGPATPDQQTRSFIPAVAISDKSIAVLPFDNLSDEKANAYFAEGIQDEILTRLAKIGALKVISRSSTKQYQSKPGNLREIAHQLGVANILEGSVQKAGEQVHINVQLIKAATDAHLWAESYDRELKNIFGVEGEVAGAIADALNAKLTGAEQKALAGKPTNNSAAYDAYLRGIAEFWKATEDSQKAALRSFDEAVQLDPKFAEAWAALSRSHAVLFFHSDATPSRREAAEKALAEATRLQPDLAETQLARGYFQYWVIKDYKGALEKMRQLRASWPNNAEILEIMAFISARLGGWQDSVDYIDQSVALNPRDFFTRNQAVELRMAIRDFETAIQMADGALQIWPNDVNFLGLKAQALQARGQLDQAQSILKGLTPNVDDLDASAAAIFYQARLRRDPEIARKLFQVPGSGTQWKLPSVPIYWAELEEMAGQKVESQATFSQVRDRLAEELKGQPGNTELMGPFVHTLAWLGEREAALSTLEKFSALCAGDARASSIAEELRARVLMRFGDKDGALAALQHVLSAPADGIFGPPLTAALLRLDPDFDPLRGDPRFQKLCQDRPN